MPCHVSAPRGSQTGTQGLKGAKARSVITPQLCQYIVDITTLYDLYDINGQENLEKVDEFTLSELKDFAETSFDFEHEFLTTGFTFYELNKRLKGIGYAAERQPVE